MSMELFLTKEEWEVRRAKEPQNHTLYVNFFRCKCDILVSTWIPRNILTSLGMDDDDIVLENEVYGLVYVEKIYEGGTIVSMASPSKTSDLWCHVAINDSEYLIAYIQRSCLEPIEPDYDKS